MQLILPKKRYLTKISALNSWCRFFSYRHLLLLTLLLNGFFSYAQAQTVTLNVKNASLESVLKKIGNQTGYEIFYQKEQLKNSLPITKSLNQVGLKAALESVFSGQPVTYVITNKTIVIVKPGPPNANQTEKQELINVHGVVNDLQNKPYPGLTVQVVNTNNYTVTDSNGAFWFKNIDPISTIRVSGLAINTSYTYLQGKTELVFVVSEKVNSLEEVVINKGYYAESERLSTGKSIKISGEDILKTPSTNPILGLQGRVPGLFIETASGLPGALQQVNIRGKNSINNASDPLYIINGVPYNSNSLSIVNSYQTSGSNSAGLSPLAALNPNDIEDITILKDADATAIYGSRGANGVILITTKKGKIGPAQTTVDYTHSISSFPKFLDLLNTQQYLEMRREAIRNDGGSIQSSDYDLNGVYDQNRYTNWQETLLGGTAQINNIQAGITGGNEQTQFIVNGGYRSQSLLFKDADNLGDKSASIRTSINHTSINKKLNLLFELNYINDNNLLPSSDPTSSAIFLAPNSPELYNADGTINFQNGSFYNNPAISLLKTVKSVTDNFLGNFRLNYKILPSLQLSANFNYNKVQLNEIGKIPFTTISPTDEYSTASVNVGRSDSKAWIAEPQLKYDTKIGQGDFSILAGTTFQQSRNTGTAFNAQGFLNDGQLDNYSSAQTKNFYTQNYSDYHYLAFYGRLNYTYKSKYIINLTGRRDGSSRFGPENQYGNFGSAGAAWIFSEEGFMNNIKWLSLGKLRMNYGITGNDRIRDYNILSTYQTINDVLYGNVTGIVPASLANPATAWESNRKIGFGVDLNFVNDRINLSVDYFRNRSGNQLVATTLPVYSGFNTIIENLPAVIQNTGLEFVLNTINIKTSELNWRSAFNLSFLKNKLVSFPTLEQSTYASFFRIGAPLTSTNYYHYTGLNPQTGLYTFEDVDKDGIISFQSDKTTVKNIAPAFYGGLTNTLTYKGFQLDVLISFVKKTAMAYLANFSAPGSFSNKPVEVLDRWQKPGDNSTVQRYTTGSFSATAGTNFFNYINSDAAVVDGSYIRLKNINLSYKLPTEWCNKVSLKGLQVYANADNLFVMTPYNGPDPEVTGASLPPLRTITMGLRVSL